MIRRTLTLALVALIAAPAAAEVYKWTDEDGEVHYSDSPPEDEGKGESSDVFQMETEDEAEKGQSGPRETDGKGPRSGTAWAIRPERLVTNLHVIEGADRLEAVLAGGKRAPLFVDKTDKNHDLALLGFAEQQPNLDPIPVRVEPASPGAKVLTIGYPHPGLMGSAPKVTTGLINSDRGAANDERLYQVSTPIQAGNSGGPLFNKKGQVVGVIVGTLNTAAIKQASGDVPQNVNYAIKSQYLTPWLGGQPPSIDDAGKVATKDLVQQVSDSVVMILAH